MVMLVMEKMIDNDGDVDDDHDDDEDDCCG